MQRERSPVIPSPAGETLRKVTHRGARIIRYFEYLVKSDYLKAASAKEPLFSYVWFDFLSVFTNKKPGVRKGRKTQNDQRTFLNPKPGLLAVKKSPGHYVLSFPNR